MSGLSVSEVVAAVQAAGWNVREASRMEVIANPVTEPERHATLVRIGMGDVEGRSRWSVVVDEPRDTYASVPDTVADADALVRALDLARVVV